MPLMTINTLFNCTRIDLNLFGKYCLCLAILFVITACGSDSNSLTPEIDAANISESTVDTNIEEEASFSGRVVKGVISNAIIKVYPIININNTYVVDKDASPITTRTNGSGYYQVRPTNKKNDQYFYLEVVTDENSKMLCDIDTGCESSDGSPVNFGESFNLTTGFTLSNVVKSKRGRINHAPISPLTHLAIKHAQAMTGGISPDNVLAGKRFIERTFELGDNALELTPTDLTSLSEIRKLKYSELKLGLISASFMPYIEQSDWDNSSTLPINEIILRANQLANFLNDGSLSTQSATLLSTLETDTFSHYQSLTATDTDIPPVIYEEPPVIYEQPSSIVVIEGETAQLNVVASSSESIRYQWLKDNLEITNETSDSLILSDARQSSEGIYSVVVTTDGGSIESLSALVTVEAAPQPVSIVTQPTSLVTTEGDNISLKVSVEGDDPITYQWQKGGSILINQTSSTLILPAITLLDAGTYSVTVSNNVNSLQSDFADISVLPAVDPITIIEHPSNTQINEGESTSLSVIASGGGFISYQWRKNSQAIPGAYSSTYAINASTSEDSGNYDVILSNSIGSKISQAATLSVIAKVEPVMIIDQSQSLSINEGEPAALFVNVSGGGTLNYQWFKDDTSIAYSNSAQFTISDTTIGDQGNYHVIVTNEDSYVRSETVYLAINPAITLPSTVQLSWSIPDAREDGSELLLSDIQGYHIVYGTDAYNLDQSINIEDGASVMTTIDLMPNTYYFKIATVEVTSVQSDFSETIEVTLE
tara:strand:- start:624 stop:2924 length:2301 start_codon:yes stop_codon:yes gene_type:complete